ncbi:MAG: hypothetical protein QXR63_03350 [Candidatus Bathyarchaeia archaeon]
MEIAILGWGSLIWNPKSLKIDGEWKTDGPLLPVEFARISKKWPLTLVIYPGAQEVQVLWALSTYKILSEAIENLRTREETTTNNIGFICIRNNKRKCHETHRKIPAIIQQWAAKKKLDAVIWTDLCSNFKEKTGKEFNEENVIKYLKTLDSEALCKAKEYVSKAPEQIKTQIRNKIMQEFHW